MKKRILAVLAMAIVLIGLSATPAMAARPCIADTLCLFDVRFLQPCCPYRYVINNQSSGICFDIPAEWDNRTNDVRNNTNKYVTFYTGNSCNGALTPTNIPPNYTANFNATGNVDEANSVRFH